MVELSTGPAIKPLVWRDHRPDSFPEPTWSAQTPFGFYNIEEVSASDSPAYVVRMHAHHFIADKDSLEEAKAAAQADYEQRIRSAIDALVPASGVGEDELPLLAETSGSTRWAVDRAKDMLSAGIDIQAVGDSTNSVVTGVVKSLLDHIDELDADLKCAIAVGRMAALAKPDASNASEARLREALAWTISEIELNKRAFAADPEKKKRFDEAKALSAGGDEATKSAPAALDVEAIKRLAHKLWSVHPKTIQDLGITREQFYAQEILSLLNAERAR